MRLRDGRSLGYAEYSDPAGKPVFFFQGTPSSRLFRHPPGEGHFLLFKHWKEILAVLVS
jgi:hypothetical protein